VITHVFVSFRCLFKRSKRNVILESIQKGEKLKFHEETVETFGNDIIPVEGFKNDYRSIHQLAKHVEEAYANVSNVVILCFVPLKTPLIDAFPLLRKIRSTLWEVQLRVENKVKNLFKRTKNKVKTPTE